MTVIIRHFAGKQAILVDMRETRRAPRAARKERSHARVVKKAAKLYRERGGDGVSVDAIMGAAGLTRGAFYAHFADKDALLAEAMAAAFDEARANMVGRDETLRGRPWLERAAHVYLSSKHVADPGSGCAAAALGAEVARADPKVRRAFTKGVEKVIDAMAERIGGRDRALAILATMIGGVVLARATDDDAFGEAVLAASRRALLR
jgi:TetR/AcrR family transcriptional repressor of nem operon